MESKTGNMVVTYDRGLPHKYKNSRGKQWYFRWIITYQLLKNDFQLPTYLSLT